MKLLNVLLVASVGVSSAAVAQPGAQHSAPVPTATPAAKVLTLSEAVKIGLEQNPSYLGQNEAVNAADAVVSQGYSLVLPQVTLQGQSLQKKDASTNTQSPFAGEKYNFYSAAIRVTQPLFQVGTFSAISAARKDWDISKLESQVAGRNLVANIINTYYLAVLSKRNVDTLLRQQQIVRESFGVARNRERFGFGQSTDSLQVQTQLALLDAQITTAQNDYQVVVANLAKLLGNREDVAFQIKDTLEAPPLAEIDGAVDLKNYNIPEITISRLQLERAEAEKHVSLGRNLPSLVLLGEYNYTSYRAADLFDGYSAGWYAGVQLTIPLFSGFSGLYEQRALSARQLQLEFAKRSTEDQITFQQVSNRKKLEAANASIQTGIEALKLAIASSNQAQRSYRVSRMEFFQFFQVQQAYVQAEQSLNTYKYNYITALANYYVASGQDLPTLVQALERTRQ